MDILRRGLLLAATVTTGLIAGLLFSYACSVMPALSRADDATFVDVMRRVNVAILNGWFLVCFVGALVFAVLAALTTLGAGHRPQLAWIVAGVVLYVVALAVTGIVNVPLNDALQAVGDRAAFESRWVAWNVVRTVAATGSFACLAWAGTLTRGLG